MKVDISVKIKRHNYFVKQKLEKSKIGEFVNLTDLLISKEKLIKELDN